MSAAGHEGGRMNALWRWFWDQFVRDPLKAIAGCGVVGCLGLIVMGSVLSIISWWLRGMGTVILIVLVIALIYLVTRSRDD